jgi:hypothetical protein
MLTVVEDSAIAIMACSRHHQDERGRLLGDNTFNTFGNDAAVLSSDGLQVFMHILIYTTGFGGHAALQDHRSLRKHSGF